MNRCVSLVLLFLLLFSLFSQGNAKGVTMSCCPYMCGKMHLPGQGKSDKKNGCQNCCGCNTMVTVNSPVYVTVDSLTLRAPVSTPVQKRLPFYCLNESSSHLAADWKPPKRAASHPAN